MSIWLQRVDKTYNRLLVATACLASRIAWWAVPTSVFWPKIEVFYKPEWTKGGLHESELWVFSNLEMNVTNS